MSDMKLTILGARGSIPVDGAKFNIFGGATSSYMVEAGDEIIFLDAGSGIVNAPDTGGRSVSILITHSHIDHILGLPFFCGLNSPGKQVKIYAKREDVDRLFSPPLWPVKIEDYPADITFHEVKDSMDIGAVRIETFPSNHPGGSVIYKLLYASKKLVYATDYEHDGVGSRELSKFCADADLILYDAQYTNEDYEKKKGYGHSTAKEGLNLLAESWGKHMLFVHHDPTYDDEKLLYLESEITTQGVRYARAGETVII